MLATLQALLARGLGGEVAATLGASVAYGDEDDALIESPPGALLVALFNAAATPEREAHGRFVAKLAQAGREVAIVVDESSVNARFGEDRVRNEARRDAWRELAGAAGLAPVFVDLVHPDVAAAEAAFEAALASP